MTVELPQSLDGSGPDRLMRVVHRLFGGLEWLHRNSRRDAGPPAPVNRDLPLVISEIRAEAEGVRSLWLTRAGGGLLPAWQPGAHLDVQLPSGRKRQYSLCGPPGERRHYRIAVRRLADGAGGSREIHDELAAGDRIVARGPRNAFPFVGGSSYLFVAGGIGITPILPMVRTAMSRGADWRLVYAGRTRASMPFLPELAELPPERVWIRPDSEFGIPAAGTELLAHAPSGAAVYACGPVPMITALRLELPGSTAKGLHWERFSAPPIVGGETFTAELARSGRTVEVPADRTALEAIGEVLPEVAYSCRQGFCGTCHVPLLSGQVHRRGRARGDDVALCVDRGRGRIAVDL